MAQIILAGDGLIIETPDEIAKSDELLKRALAPHYPDLANAQITRETQDGVLKVTVSKRAGPKGNGRDASSSGDLPITGESAEGNANPVLAALDAAPPYLNPALALAWQLARREVAGTRAESGDNPGMRLEEQLVLQAVISEAILEGELESRLIGKSVEALQQARAVPARCVPGGF